MGWGMRLLGAAVFGLVAVVQVRAAPITFACQLLRSSDVMQDINQVDQIIVDRDSQSMEMRVANTIGTSKPRIWKFEAKPAEFGTYFFTSDDNADKALTIGHLAIETLLVADFAAAYSFVTMGSGSVVTWSCSR
jgi:hypothetical protein